MRRLYVTVILKLVSLAVFLGIMVALLPILMVFGVLQIVGAYKKWSLKWALKTQVVTKQA